MAWLTIDEGDNDAVRFLHNLGSALHQAQPGLGAVMLSVIQAPQQPDLSSLLTGLLREIEAVQTGILLVLDEIHWITNERLLQALTFLAEHRPPNLFEIFISDLDLPELIETIRQDANWPFIDQEALRFTPTEAKKMLATVCGVEVTKYRAKNLVDTTGGAALSIQLAGFALRDHPEPKAFWDAAKTGSRYFFLDQALERQMESVREFLIFTAILNYLNGDLCDHVLRASPSGLQAPGRGRATLEHLSKLGFFTTSLDEEKTWFRYHPTIADMLREHLKFSFSGSMELLHQRASQWYELNDALEPAIHHALEAGDEERASVLIELNALTWVGSGELATALNWLGRLPAGTVLLRPWLCLAEAWSTASEGWQQGTETLLSVMETAAETMSSSASQRALGHVAAIRMSLAEGDDAAMRKEALARQALELLPPQDRSYRCHVATLLGLELRNLGRINAASEAFAETVACANQGENPTTSILAICQLADLHMVEGLVQKVLSLSEEALFLAQNHLFNKEYPLLPAGLAHIYAGIATYERDELEVAQSHFENAITFCDLWGQPAYTAAGQALLAETYFARGNEGTAKKIALQARETLLHAGSSWAEFDPIEPKRTDRQALYIAVRPACTRARLAALAIVLQDVDSAIEWLEDEGYQSSDPFDFSQAQVYLSAAKVLLAQRNIFEARRLIRYLVATCEAVGAHYCLIKSLVLQAQLLQHSSDYQSALVSLRRAVQMAEGENYIRTFIDGYPDVGVLLQRLGTSGPGSPYARAIVSAIERQDQRGVSPEVPVALSTRPLTRPLPTIDRAAGVTLTDREKEVIRLLESYLTEVEIAYRLSISTRTVDTLVRNLCWKLGVRESREIAPRARQLKAL